MAILGTKKFWKPAQGVSYDQKQNQILKNSGYINLQLRTVNYMSKGNIWQDVFGGKDKIALSTTIKYQNSGNTIEATTIQDVREVKVNANYNFGLQRNLAVKVPANADAVSLEVKMTAVKGDMLQAKFDMLNQADYQSALQLAPSVVGQLLTVTSLVKKLFSDTDPKVALEASFAGIISLQQEEQPVANGKLTRGLLIMVSTNEGDKFENVDEDNFELKGDTLYYSGKQVENTYMVFSVGFDEYKGDDEKANWFKKYNEALNNLDKILNFNMGVAHPNEVFNAETEVEITRILKTSMDLWIEGNALIDADDTYINRERLNIKNAALNAIRQKYNSLYTPKELDRAVNGTGFALKSMVRDIDLSTIEMALPETGSFYHDLINPNKNDLSESVLLSLSRGEEESFNILLAQDSQRYLATLRENDISFKLGSIRYSRRK